jgi:hypothetical protein
MELGKTTAEFKILLRFMGSVGKEEKVGGHNRLGGSYHASIVSDDGLLPFMQDTNHS